MDVETGPYVEPAEMPRTGLVFAPIEGFVVCFTDARRAPVAHPYSYRNASIGFTRDARNAGMKPAEATRA